MKINEKQIKSVSNLKPFDRYKYFIKRFADWEYCFVLIDENKNFVITELEGNKLLHLWSAPEFAELCLIGPWEYYKVEKITLKKFIKEIIGFVEEKKILIDVFPVENRSGFVVNLQEFARDLNDELENYD